MGKGEVLAALETDLSDPGSLKSGEYLEEHVLRRARQIVANDRSGLVEVLEDWILLRAEPRTALAVSVAKTLRMRELRELIVALREDVAQGKALWPHYLRGLDETIKALTS